MTDDTSFSQQCSGYLKKKWKQINQIEENDLDEPLSNELEYLKNLIKNCLKSNTKTYRYVLPTQLLCKGVD